MASKEIFDYLDDKIADHDYTLSLDPQAVLTENVFYNQLTIRADDNSEEILSFNTDPIPYITIQYNLLNEADAGTLLDFYMDSAKGQGILYSFYFSHPDSHDYVVRFDTNISRNIKPTIYGFSNIKLRVLGRKAE